MTIGEKIKKIRTFRGLTQKELGIAIGFSKKSAGVRMAQYETNVRTPKKELLVQIAVALKVDPLSLYNENPGSTEDVIQKLLWLEENNPEFVQLNDGKDNLNESGTVYVEINHKWVDRLMAEWLLRKSDLQNGTISKREYFEWKINAISRCGTGKELNTKWET